MEGSRRIKTGMRREGSRRIKNEGEDKEVEE